MSLHASSDEHKTLASRSLWNAPWSKFFHARVVALNETGGGFRSGNFTIMTEWSDMNGGWTTMDTVVDWSTLTRTMSSVWPARCVGDSTICFRPKLSTSVVNFTVAGSVMTSRRMLISPSITTRSCRRRSSPVDVQTPSEMHYSYRPDGRWSRRRSVCHPR